MEKLEAGRTITGDFTVTKVISQHEVQLSNDILGDGFSLKFDEPHVYEEGDVLQGEIRVESRLQ